MTRAGDRQEQAVMMPFATEEEALRATVTPTDLGLQPARVWNPSPTSTHRTAPYPVPQDITIGVRGNELTAAKYSPPPFAVIIEDADGQCVLLNVAADAGWHRWSDVVFESRADSVTVTIDLQGRTSPREAAEHVRLQVVHGKEGETRHALLQRGLQAAYPEASPPSTIPDWWLQPIYCGWGDQVATAYHLEGPAGTRGERRALAYCTQGLYQRWVDRLVEAEVPVGTVIIDHGWSPAGWWEPHDLVWPDLKEFIARQHDAGRRVLLWLATWLTDGLPDEWCIYADDRKLVSDPTNPAYLEQAQQWVHELISPDGYDADGFKIDQLAYVPNTRRARGGKRFGYNFEVDAPTIRCHDSDSAWGCEMLYRLQKAMYDAAKGAKPDALVTSSTVHPYFHDTFDMVRLHDTGTVSDDVLEAMSSRTALAQAALPGKPIDSDDWVHSDYEAWMYYTMNNHKLGVPCIFYSHRFMQDWDHEPATRSIPMEDLGRIAQAWDGYVRQVEGSAAQTP